MLPVPVNIYGNLVQQQNLDLFADAERWPHKPYIAEANKRICGFRSLKQALTKPYIQPNPPHLRVWSVFDVDRAGGALAWEDGNLPPPSWAAANPENAHAHLVWGLSAPVLVDSPDMRQKPLRYLCAVEAAFRERLRADTGYVGLLTKNPSHARWRVLRGPHSYYELGYLAEWVDLPKHLPKRNPEEIGLGRNVTVFEWLRQYAYRHIKTYKGAGRDGYEAWKAHINFKALSRNGELSIPLEGNEVWHIAKSVSKWTWNKFDIAASDARFSKLQAARSAMASSDGRRKAQVASAAARSLASEDKRASARLMVVKGMSQRAIALELGVSQKTVSNWLRSE
ncbi:MAG: replication initiation protein [Comamonas sp.]